MARRKPIRRFLWKAVFFAMFGALVGIPISYQFQSGLVKALISRRDYTAQVFKAAPGEIWKGANSGGGPAIDPLGVVATLTTTMLVCAGTTTIIGLRLTRRKR